MNEPHRPYDSVIMQNMSHNAADNVHYLNILFWPSTLKGREKWVHFFGPVNGKTKVCKDPPSGSFWQKNSQGLNSSRPIVLSTYTDIEETVGDFWNARQLYAKQPGMSGWRVAVAGS